MLLEMQQSGSILPKSAAGQAISYMLNRWEMSFYKLDTSFLVSAKFSLSHAAISAPQLLDCEALFGSE